MQRAIWLLLAFFFVIYSLIALSNHAKYQTYGFDLGIYDQIVWKYSLGLPAISSLYKDIEALGIHFQPLLFFLAPLYLVFDDVRALLVLQVLAVVIAAYPLYLIARDKLSSVFAGISIALSYLLYFGTQRGVFLDFHTDAFFPLFFAVAWLGYERRRFAFFAIGIGGLLLLKEWAGPFVATIGIVLFLLDRSLFKWSLFCLFGGIGVFLVAIYGFILPLAGSQSAVFGYGDLGNTPLEAARTVLTNPSLAIYHLIVPSEKVKTIFFSLLPFGPWFILVPSYLILLFEQFALRFWDLGHPYRWGTNLQYSITLGPILAIVTAKGMGVFANTIMERFPRWYVIHTSCALLLLLTFATQYLFHLPILGILKPEFYYIQPWQQDTNLMLKLIPKEARVTTQNNLAPHLSHRDRLYLLPEIKDADFIALDLHPGQSLYNLMFQSESQSRSFVQSLLQSGAWSVHYQKGDAMLLKRV